jgi:hypothetical protein
MSDARIGILGGYGAVGRVVAERLDAQSAVTVRLGGRNEGAARAFIAESLGGRGEAMAVDLDDAEALARFCAGCDVVVNCSGPSYRVLDSVARAAAVAGASYVDAGGDDPVYELLADFSTPAVLSAGMAPGITGIMPRWLARQGFTEVHGLTAHVAARDRFTIAAAGDYLLSLGNGYGTPLAEWADGRPVPRALEPMYDVTLPFFTGPQTAYPYLTTETERTAEILGLRLVRWYNVFDRDGRVMSTAGRLQAALRQGDIDLAGAAAELVRAADFDLFGRGPRQQFVLRMDGVAGGEPVTRTAVLRATGTYLLTGVVCAEATRAVLDGVVPAGVHFAPDVLDPDAVMAQVRCGPGVDALEDFDGEPETAAAEGEYEEGEL